MATTATKMQKTVVTTTTDNNQWLLSVRVHGSLFEALHCVFCGDDKLGPKFCEYVNYVLKESRDQRRPTT